jgi:phosphoribosylpyrophosphate synthetase
MRRAVTNCTNHLRDIHKIISPRSAKIVRRKPDGADSSEENAGGASYKKRPHSLLSTTRPTSYAEAAAVAHPSHPALMHPAAAGLYASSMGIGMSSVMQQQQQQQQQHGAPSSTSSSSASNAVLNESWQQYFNKNHNIKYQVIAAPGMENMAQTIAQMHPGRFLYHKTQWGKFPDGTDNIMIGGFQPVNRIAGENVLMLASFTNNSTTLTQLLVMVTLLQSFIESLTVVLPFYPVGTMERVSREGQVATASTYAQMLSNLPNCGKPTRLVIYDLHTLQNRFYLHGNAIASMQTTIPLLIERMRSTHINCIAFPDDGALKRFGFMLTHLGFEIVICGKTHDGDKRVISIQDGRPYGKHVIVIDDLAQTGTTAGLVNVCSDGAVGGFSALRHTRVVYFTCSNFPPLTSCVSVYFTPLFIYRLHRVPVRHGVQSRRCRQRQRLPRARRVPQPLLAQLPARGRALRLLRQVLRDQLGAQRDGDLAAGERV